MRALHKEKNNKVKEKPSRIELERICIELKFKKDIDSVLQILQVPFDTTQRVTQLRCGPFNLGASTFAQLTPTQIESSCFVQRFEDLTAMLEEEGKGKWGEG